MFARLRAALAVEGRVVPLEGGFKLGDARLQLVRSSDAGRSSVLLLIIAGTGGASWTVQTPPCAPQSRVDEGESEKLDLKKIGPNEKGQSRNFLAGNLRGNPCRWSQRWWLNNRYSWVPGYLAMGIQPPSNCWKFVLPELALRHPGHCSPCLVGTQC